MGDNVREHPRRLPHEREALPAGHHERGRRNGGRPLSRQRVIAHDGGVVAERVRKRLLSLPERRVLRVGDELGRKAHHLRHEIFDRVAPAACRYHLVVSLYLVCRRSATLVEAERRLPHCQHRDGEPARRSLKRQGTTGGRTVYERRSAGCVDHFVEILDLALDCIERRIGAVTTAPAVVVEYGEVLGQELGQWRVRPAIGRCATHQDDRRSITQSIEGDGGAVFGSYCIHEALLPIRARDPAADARCVAVFFPSFCLAPLLRRCATRWHPPSKGASPSLRGRKRISRRSSHSISIRAVGWMLICLRRPAPVRTNLCAVPAGTTTICPAVASSVSSPRVKRTSHPGL